MLASIMIWPWTCNRHRIDDANITTAEHPIQVKNTHGQPDHDTMKEIGLGADSAHPYIRMLELT